MEEPLPITGVEELERHLQQMLDDPETPLNAKLLDEVDLQLTGLWFHIQPLPLQALSTYFLSRLLLHQGSM
jgi:hypothetical protein